MAIPGFESSPSAASRRKVSSLRACPHRGASELQVLQSWGSVHGELAAGARSYSTDFIPLLGCSPASPEPSADELEASIGSSYNPLSPKILKALRFAPQLPHPHPQDMSSKFLV